MQEKLLIITSYPERYKIHGVGTVGIASYAKNTLISLLTAAKQSGKTLALTVFAEIMQYSANEKQVSDEPNFYREEEIAVKRIWRRGNIMSYLVLLREISKQNDTTVVLFEFELSMFGGILSLLLLPLFLLCLGMMHKKVYFVLHQVISDINVLSEHIGLQRGTLKIAILNTLLRSFYALILLLTYRVIVFEDCFKEYFLTHWKTKKIVVIPHGVQQFANRMSTEEAKRRLGLSGYTVLLVFGFAAWYKGTDWITDAFSESTFLPADQKTKLILAGGGNPNHRNKLFYTEYVQTIQDKAHQSNGKILYTGFIPENEISIYFSASDLVVLPYRALMSSSGPLSLAFSFKKPFVVSEALQPIFMSEEMKRILRTNSLQSSDFIFQLRNNSAQNIITNAIGKKEVNAKLRRFAEEIGRKRDFLKIGALYLSVLST
jgi:glycosyltransferase involved in cell wall biosynthesis